MLELRNIWVVYGRSRAVRGLSLSVARGEVVALVGANGAGKSSTVGAVAGTVPLAAGSVLLHGRPIDALPPEDRARQGVSLVPEGRRVFATLSVEENLRLGLAAGRTSEGWSEAYRRVTDLFPVLGDKRRAPAGLLSGGEQQQLAIARALVSNPDVLLLDEPSLGLAPVVIDVVFDRIAELRRTGQAVLLIEQNAARAAELADRVLVLDHGRLVAEESGERARQDLGLASRYFGKRR